MCCIVFRRHTGAVQIDTILRRKPISCSSGKSGSFWTDQHGSTALWRLCHTSALEWTRRRPSEQWAVSKTMTFSCTAKSLWSIPCYGWWLGAEDDTIRTNSIHPWLCSGQLLASIYEWAVWTKFLPAQWASASLLLTCAVKLLRAQTIALQQIMRRL